jgi:TetR/AcrR family transcriptional repressor of nem operon
MINSMAQLGTRVPEVVAITRRTTERMESGVAARIRAAASRPGPADEEIEVLAAHIVLVSQGLIQLSRQGVSAERLRAIAETSRAGLPSYCAA